VTPGILYISYDGMLEPLGQSQVLAYLEKLAPGRRIHLISFEKARDWSNEELRESIRRRIADAGIRWHPLRYHKSPTAPATAFDIAAGSALAVALALRHRLRVVHARSYVPALMALAVKRATGASFLFDMRGFWADERIDGGLWPRDGRLYRAAKSVERNLLLAADHVVTLTHASEAELRRWPYLQGRTPPISVIPTCADLDRFTIQGPLQRDPFVLGYVGSVGTWYLLDEMLQCFLILQREMPDARLLIVNRHEQTMIRDRLSAHSIARSDADVISSNYQEMPVIIGRMTAAMALYKPSYSRLACAPTKVGEYLGSGVPCLANRGIGDLEQVLDRRCVGDTASSLAEADLAMAVRRMDALVSDKCIQERCRNAATELFSLEHGVEDYASIYRLLSRLPD
jgi:glycosyltransferase involved in cell wall biosynthesis